MYSKNSKYSPQSYFKPQVLYNLEISGKIQLNEDDPNYPYHHQEPQEDGRCPPSMGRFLTTIFHLTPKYYIFLETSGKIKFNEDEPNHHDLDKEPQKYGGHPYFWNPQAKSMSMKITPTFMITIRNLSITEYGEVPDNYCSTQHQQQQQK